MGRQRRKKRRRRQETIQKKPQPHTELDNLECPVIGARWHTKAKRQVPGRVNLRLNICLSLSKLIHPLQL